MARFGFGIALPWTRGDGVVLPLLALAHGEHHQPEDKHEHAPGQVQVDAERAVVERTVAREEAEEFAGIPLVELKAEVARREADLGRLRAQCLEVELRIVARRLHSLREEMARREAAQDDEIVARGEMG